MRVLVCEFVTGGGMRGEALPASLAREGQMMRDALAEDLTDLPGFDIDAVVTHDDRLPAPFYVDETVGDGDDVWALWTSLAGGCELAWPVAPETGGLLARLTETLERAGTAVLGSELEAVRIASSKRLTAERLLAAGVPTPPVWRPGETPARLSGPFVLKPDDGAGCVATRLVERPPDDAPAGSILQPYVAGEAASLTCYCDLGRTHVLAVNRQHVAIEDGGFRFEGLTVGAYDDPDGRLAALASAVGDAIPGLKDFFGIDIVMGPEGPEVIEVNARVTTAYCGLKEAIGFNPLALVLGVRDDVPKPRIRPVEIRL